MMEIDFSYNYKRELEDFLFVLKRNYPTVRVLHQFDVSGQPGRAIIEIID